MSAMGTKLDIVVFGASGFTGEYVIEQLDKITAKERVNINWGVAGRSREKLQAVLHTLGQKTNKNFDHITIMEADTSNDPSLTTMTSNARLIINCVGPYKYHGQAVVQACIRQKCHYIDITAEPQFMELVQLQYQEAATHNGVYVVTSCGIDNIPADMGLDFVQKQFDGTLNSVECYQELLPEEGFGKGVIGNCGTWESFLLVMLDYNDLKETRRKLFPKRLPQMEPKLARRYLHKIPFSRNHAGPYPGGEATVMRRSQRYFYETKKTRPIQVRTYCGSPKYWHYIILFLGFMWLLLLLKFKFTVNLLRKHPRILTFGFFGAKPNKETINKLQVTTTFHGRGWKGKVVDENYKEREDSWIVVKVKGRDPYVVTGICAVSAALVMLDGSQKFPEKGGVYTTAGFFSETNLVEVLQRNGLEFGVQEQGSL